MENIPQLQKALSIVKTANTSVVQPFLMKPMRRFGYINLFLVGGCFYVLSDDYQMWNKQKKYFQFSVIWNYHKVPTKGVFETE